VLVWRTNPGDLDLEGIGGGRVGVKVVLMVKSLWGRRSGTKV
jgi:hypothetical protein